jgi:hypothetical protein
VITAAVAVSWKFCGAKPTTQQSVLGQLENSAPVFCLVMLQVGLCYIATPTGSLYLCMNPIELWVAGGMFHKCD